MSFLAPLSFRNGFFNAANLKSAAQLFSQKENRKTLFLIAGRPHYATLNALKYKNVDQKVHEESNVMRSRVMSAIPHNAWNVRLFFWMKDTYVGMDFDEIYREGQALMEEKHHYDALYALSEDSLTRLASGKALTKKDIVDAMESTLLKACFVVAAADLCALPRPITVVYTQNVESMNTFTSDLHKKVHGNRNIEFATYDEIK